MVAHSHYQGENNEAPGLSPLMRWDGTAWCGYMGVLPDLERELQRAGKIGFFEFQVLIIWLSARNMTMSQLAAP